MKKFFIIILFLIGFILIGFEGGNLFSQMGINIPFLDYKEEKQLPKFIGVILCLVSIFLFRSSRKRKLNEVQQKINVEKEKNDHVSVEVKKWKYPDYQWKMWHNTGMDRAEWEKFMDQQKEIENQAIRKENEKRERLLKIYTKEEVDKIMSKQLWLGMTEETLFEARSRPLDISESVSKGVVKKKHYYDKSTNRLGNDAFDFEVTLEDGIVTGWKDRRNRGTRDI
jgi:hypothetical protein